MEGLATLIVGRGCVERYQARISGPLLDRIDLQIEVPAVSAAADLVLSGGVGGKRRGSRPRAPRRGRSRPSASPALKHPRARTNADCDGSLLEDIAAPDSRRTRQLLDEAADALGLSARGLYTALCRVARTLADLDGEARGRPHPYCRGLELSRRRRCAARRPQP